MYIFRLFDIDVTLKKSNGNVALFFAVYYYTVKSIAQFWIVCVHFCTIEINNISCHEVVEAGRGLLNRILF